MQLLFAADGVRHGGSEPHLLPRASDSTLRGFRAAIDLKMGACRVPPAIPHDVKLGIGVRLTAALELRASKVVSPRPADGLTVGIETFIVQGEPERRDPERLVWMLDARSA